MKMVMYTMKNSDGLCGLPYCASNDYNVAKSIQAFYKKVGEYEALTWWKIGYFDMDSCELIPLKPIEIDWQDIIAHKEVTINPDALETSELAKEAECE